MLKLITAKNTARVLARLKGVQIDRHCVEDFDALMADVRRIRAPNGEDARIRTLPFKSIFPFSLRLCCGNMQSGIQAIWEQHSRGSISSLWPH